MKFNFLTMPFLTLGLCVNAIIAMEPEEEKIDLKALLSILPQPMIEQMDDATKRAFRETCMLACTEVGNFLGSWNKQHSIQLGWEFPLNPALSYHLNRYVIAQVYFSDFIVMLPLPENGPIQVGQVHIEKIGDELSYITNFLGDQVVKGALSNVEELMPDDIHSASRPKILAKIGCILMDQSLNASDTFLCTTPFKKFKGTTNQVELWRHLSLTPADKITFFQKIGALAAIPRLENRTQMQNIFRKIKRIQEIEANLPNINIEAENNEIWQELLNLDPYMTPDHIRNAMYCNSNYFAKEHPQPIQFEENYENYKPYFENIYNISKRLIDLQKNSASQEDISWHFHNCISFKRILEEETYIMAMLLIDKMPLESWGDGDISNLCTILSERKSVESKKIKEFELFLQQSKKYDDLLSLYLARNMDQEAIALYKQNRDHFLNRDTKFHNIPSMLSKVAMSCLFHSAVPEAFEIWESIKSNSQPSPQEIILAIAIHLMQGNEESVWGAIKAYDEKKHELSEKSDDRAPNNLQEAFISLLKGDQGKAIELLEASSDQMSEFSLIYLKEKMGYPIGGLEPQYFLKYGHFEDSKKEFKALVTYIDLILQLWAKKGL